VCYAIPGRVVSVEGKTVAVDYFGELRKAHAVDCSVQPGEYIYAQGGIVVGKISEAEALPILEAWKERFFELKKVDAELSSGSAEGRGALGPAIKKARAGEALSREDMLTVLSAQTPAQLETLYSAANRLRKERLGNACCVHGILEFSNHCRNDCHYCGIRFGNGVLERYRMDAEEISEAVGHAADNLGFKAIVLQSGEDSYYKDEMLAAIVKKLHERYGILITLSIGERSRECYRRLYEAGAYGALLRFETSNEAVYSRVRPGKKLADRLELIKWLKSMGFVLATGFLIGLPGQTAEDTVNDILLTKSLGPDMYSFGPFIPHPATPLAFAAKPTQEDILKAIALSRLADPQAKILVTTALETLGLGARAAGLLSGANSLMINTTPPKYRRLYDLYPGKAGTDEPLEDAVLKVVELLRSLGRAPADLGV